MVDSPVHCPVCGGSQPHTFVYRKNVVAQQNLPQPSAAEARALPRGDLDMRCCPACGFVFNAVFDAQLVDYGPSYDNQQNYSPVFAEHTRRLATELIEDYAVREARVVDIGCGKGAFLHLVVEAGGAGNTGLGFDPTYVGPLTDADGRLQFEQNFYEKPVPADVYICRHVIEHVAEPLSLLNLVTESLSLVSSARAFFETPDVTWILEHGVIWDLFYEHCSLFTPDSLVTAFEHAGMSIESLRAVFGQQYMWLEAARGPATSPSRDPGRIVELADRFSRTESEQIGFWRQTLDEAAGNAVLWGAGAKGVTFVNLVDPEAKAVMAVTDINPGKQGRFIPGTGHRIVGPEALSVLDPSVIYVLNPNYVGEVAAEARRLGLRGRVVDLMEACRG